MNEPNFIMHPTNIKTPMVNLSIVESIGFSIDGCKKGLKVVFYTPGDGEYHYYFNTRSKLCEFMHGIHPWLNKTTSEPFSFNKLINQLEVEFKIEWETE